jgi:hypothetical protein
VVAAIVMYITLARTAITPRWPFYKYSYLGKIKKRTRRKKETKKERKKDAANQSCTFEKVFEEKARRRSYIKRRGTRNCEKEISRPCELEPVERAESSR